MVSDEAAVVGRRSVTVSSCRRISGSAVDSSFLSTVIELAEFAAAGVVTLSWLFAVLVTAKNNRRSNPFLGIITSFFPYAFVGSIGQAWNHLDRCAPQHTRPRSRIKLYIGVAFYSTNAAGCMDVGR